MALLLPGILALMPLLILPGILFYFDVTPKIAVLLLGAAAGLLFLHDNARAARELLSTRTGRLFVLILTLLQLSLLLSTREGLSVAGTNWRRFGLVTQSALVVLAFLLAAHFAHDSRILSRCLRVTAWAGCIMSVYAIAQYFGIDPWLSAAAYHAGEGQFTIVRPPATLGHAGYLATYLLISLFSGVSFWPSERLLPFSVLALIPLAIILSGTRAALLGLAFGAIMIGVRQRWRWRSVAVVSAAAATVLAALIISPAGAQLRARIHWSLDDVWGGARLWMWRDSLDLAASHPFIGNGLETFGNAFPPHQSVELARAYPDFYHESPHNIFLDAFCAQGLPGLVVWLGLCCLIIRRVLRGETDIALSAAFAAALISLQFTSFTAATACAFLMICAALLTDRVSVPIDIRVSRWSWAALPVAALFAIAGIRLLAADFELQQTARAFDHHDPIRAAQHYVASRSWALPGGSPDIYYARRMANAGQLTQALEAAARATQVAEDRPNALYNLAALVSVTNDSSATELCLRQAIVSAPRWFKPHWTLALLYERLGRQTEARTEAALAAGFDGGKHTEVAATLRRLSRE